MAAVEALLASERARFISAEQAYKNIPSDSTEQRLYADFKILEQQYLNTHEHMMSLSRTNRNSEAFEIIRGQATNIYDAARVRLQAAIAYHLKLSE